MKADPRAPSLIVLRDPFGMRRHSAPRVGWSGWSLPTVVLHIIASCALLGAANVFPAEGAKDAGKSKALHVTGDKVTRSDDNATIVAEGNASAVWLEVEVRADRIEVKRLPGPAWTPPLKLAAKGSVRVKHKKATLEGAELNFDCAKMAIDMSEVRGKCRLDKKEVALQAKRLVFHVLTKRIVATGQVRVESEDGKLEAEQADVDLQKGKIRLTKPRLRFRLR